MKCAQVRELFGAYWDDEITQAEREWIESHFAACAECRSEYEAFSRTLELVSSLPREEAAPDLVERVMARTRRATPSPDRLPAGHIGWIPVTAAAALLILAGATLSPWLIAPIARRAPSSSGPQVASRVVSAPIPSPSRPAPRAVAQAPNGAAVATIADSLFDHSEDIEFILDPGT
ncbi:MAG TPA: zf-HC2 domain-containing protein, partial [Candidatus Udaeobacter sp.]|nr:zf-HC2 domain-containing protein [Candidatus Udaeobacter sp.]